MERVKIAREAVKLLKYYISNEISFNQETTLSGKSIIRNMITSKSNGYYVVMNYIGIESPDIVNGELKWKSIILPNWTKDIL